MLRFSHVVPTQCFFGGSDGTAVDIFNTFEASENPDLEDCHHVVTVAVMAASLLACLAATRKKHARLACLPACLFTCSESDTGFRT